MIFSNKFRLPVLACLIFSGFSQLSSFAKEEHNELDSLKAELSKATNDSVKIYLRLEIGEDTPIERIGYWDTLAADAERTGQKKHMVECLDKLGLLYVWEGNHTKAMEAYKKSLNTNQSIGDENGEGNSYNNIAFVYGKQGDVEKALEANNQCLKIREKLGDGKGIANSYNNLGNLYQSNNDPFKALEYYKESLRIREKGKDKKATSNSLNNIAVLYKNQNNVEKALEYFKMCKSLREETGDKEGLCHLYNNIGIMYQEQNDVQKAFENYNNALNLSKESGDKDDIAEYSYKIGLLYENAASKEKNPETQLRDLYCALEYQIATLKLEEEIGDKKDAAKTMNKLAAIYAALALNNQSAASEKSALAKEFTEKGLKECEELNYRKGIISALNIKGEALIRENNYKDAEECFLRSLKLAQEEASFSDIFVSSNALSKIYSSEEKISSLSTDRVKSAEEMKQLAAAMTDSIKNTEERTIAFKKKVQQSFEEQEIAYAASLIEEEKKEKTIKTAGIGGTILVIIIAGIAIRRSKKKKNK